MEQVWEFFRKLFDTESWPARWNCGEWSEFHGWLYIISDFAIWGAYFTIPVLLVYFLSKKDKIPFKSIFVLFSLFILACGATHLIDGIIFWWPVYRLSALMQVITAAVSWITVIALVKIIPMAMALKTPEDLERTVEERTTELEEKKAEAEASNNELKMVNKQLDEFNHIVSHDLKAPLRAVSHLSDWIVNDKENDLSEESRKNFSLMRERLETMQELIEDILRVSRAGKSGLKKEEINAEQKVRKIIKTLNPPENIEIRINGELPVVYYPKVHFTQVFQNLLDNAIKYLDKENGLIEIGCSSKESWEFYVKDNGPGIENRYFDDIFKMFQVLPGHKEGKDSTGIGLAIVRRIIQSNGGKISVESEIGKGTTFYFTIPKS